jgi:hypothetical protein
MAQQLTIAPAGLFTDPNPLSAAPDGAMTEALNVVIARPGVVEPRPGLLAQSLFTALLVDEDIIAMIPFESDILVLTKDASDGTGHAYWYTANDDMTQTGTFAESDWGLTVGRVHGAAMNGNLYVTCGEGVFRCTAPGDDTAARAGIPRPAQALADSATTGAVNYPLAADQAFAYRFCETLTAGRIVVRSAPSARTIQRSYVGSSDKFVTLTFAVAPDNTTEIYRSPVIEPYTETPSDELTAIGSAAAAASSFVDDAGTTALRGSALYTNATQGGALLENGVPPLCRDVAYFRDMLFFGGATLPPVVAVEVFGMGPDWRSGVNAANHDRLVYTTVTATATLGSPTVTGVNAADIAEVRAGMRFFSGSGDPTTGDSVWPAGTTIQSVGVNTITMSANALDTTGASSWNCSDWIEVDLVDSGGTTTNRVYAFTSGTGYMSPSEFVNNTSGEVRGPQAFAYEMTRLFDADGKSVVMSALGDGVDTPWIFVAEALNNNATSITIKTSNPAATPDRVDASTGKTSTVSGSPATLRWSKPGEPEHCPPGYSQEIGASDKAIERIVPARDSLFVFKEDGVWRVSGYSPDTLQVDEFDRTMRLIHPNAVCEWGGGVAAWTNQGVVILSDGGVTEISKPIANVLEAAASLHLAVVGSTIYQGLFLTAWHERGLLLLGVPRTASTGYAEYIYCWSQRTGAWTRWTHTSEITCAAAVGGTLYLGTNSANSSSKAVVLKSVDISTTGGAYDVSTAITISNVSGSTITISAGSGWTPAIGDRVVRSGSLVGTVTSVASATVFTVNASDLTTGSATARTRSAMTVEWTVRDGGNAGAQKLFRTANVLLGSVAGLQQISSSFTTDRSQTAATSNASLTYTGSVFPTTVRKRMPREAKRCTRLEHAMTFLGAVPEWALHGVSYEFEPLSTRAKAFSDG